MQQLSLQEAWELLLSGNKRIYTKLGFYTPGDAYAIVKDSNYKNQIVLVEHREKTQYNHWGHRCNKSETSCIPTITTNGNDGNGCLKRKAPKLKVLED